MTDQREVPEQVGKARSATLAAEEQMRLLLAYGREFIKPHPYQLKDLAQETGMSISGARSAYSIVAIATVARRIGRQPRARITNWRHRRCRHRLSFEPEPHWEDGLIMATTAAAGELRNSAAAPPTQQAAPPRPHCHRHRHTVFGGRSLTGWHVLDLHTNAAGSPTSAASMTMTMTATRRCQTRRC